MSQPRSNNKWLVLAVLAVAAFVMNLDSTIVNIALPKMMTSLNASIADVEWVINAYILVFAAGLITMGRLGDIFGRKRFFIGGLALFTLASLLCSLSPNIEFLIASRVLQAIGGTAMMPATLSLLNVAFKDGNRGLAMGVWGAVSGAASALGPIIGGALVSAFNWPAIFYVNIPIGILAAIAGIIYIKESREAAASKHLDFPGIATAAIALFCLTFALVEGQTYGWTSATILGFFGVSLVSFVVFLVAEKRSSNPLIDLSLFKNRSFSAGNTLALLLMFALIGIVFLLTLFLQMVLGFSAIKTGLAMLPMPLAMMLVAPFAGKLSDKRGVRWMLSGGMLLTAISLFLMAHLSVDTTWQSLIFPLFLGGFGLGLIMAPQNAIVMASAPIEKSGAASGVMTTVRQIGAVMGISILGAVMQTRLISNLTSALASVSSIPQAVKDTILSKLSSGGMSGSMDLSSVPAELKGQMMQLFSRQFAASLNTALMVAVVLCLVGALVALLINYKPKT